MVRFVTRFLVPLLAAGLAAAAVLIGAGCDPPPLVEAPGARLVAVARTADAVAVVEALDRAGLVDAAPLRAAGPSLVADAPIVVSVLEEGVVVVAARVDASAGLLAASADDAPSRPVLGKTRAIVAHGVPLLVRTDRSRVLAALGVPPAREATVAATIELMAGSNDSRLPHLPRPGAIDVRVARGVSPVELGPIEATVRLEGETLRVDARAPAPPAEVVSALAAPSPPWACGLEEGAALVVHVPPLPGVVDDAFRGRMLLAGYPGRDGIALAVAGVPADERVLDEAVAPLLDERRATVRSEGAARVIEVKGERLLRIVRAPGVFVAALDVGDEGAVPLEKLGAAGSSSDGCSSSALIRVDAAALTRLLMPVVLTRETLLRALVTGEGAEEAVPPFLRGVSRFDLDGDAKEDGIHLRAALELRAVPD